MNLCEHHTCWLPAFVGFGRVSDLASIPDLVSGRLCLKGVICSSCPLMTNVLEEVMEGSGEYIQLFFY